MPSCHFNVFSICFSLLTVVMCVAKKDVTKHANNPPAEMVKGKAQYVQWVQRSP